MNNYQIRFKTTSLVKSEFHNPACIMKMEHADQCKDVGGRSITD